MSKKMKLFRNYIRKIHLICENERRGKLAFKYVDTYGLPENTVLKILKETPIQQLSDKDCNEIILNFKSNK